MVILGVEIGSIDGTGGGMNESTATVMDTFKYQSKWDKKELNKFTLDDFKDLKVTETTIDFFVTIGLPDDAAPFLSFDRKELKTIKEVYSTDDSDDNFLVDIGFDGAGDPICIDIQNNCQIVALDHEDNFTPRFVNTSVQELFAFLTIYKDFGDKLRQIRGEDAFIDSNFTDLAVRHVPKGMSYF